MTLILLRNVVLNSSIKKALNDYLTARRIRSEWKAAGLCPFKSREGVVSYFVIKLIPALLNARWKRAAFEPSNPPKKLSQMTAITQNLIVTKTTKDIAVLALEKAEKTISLLVLYAVARDVEDDNL